MRVFLGLGVLGGAALALLAGLATATRAMAPITRLTEAASTIARTRDPSERIPHPESNDEVSELALTLENMLQALNEARGETEAALTRQREFVADASHELRTPLTSVLANLELLEMELEGEPREAAASALRSSRRMRRLVADLLLLARADAGRVAPHVPVDLSEVVTEAAGELEPVAGEHHISVSATPGAEIEGARDELHRLTLNLLENALRHTDPGHGGRGVGRAAQRRGRALGRGRRPGDPAGAARQGVRALLPRRGRPQRLERPRALDRARRRGLARRAPCRWRSRSTGAERASWCAFPRRERLVHASSGGRASQGAAGSGTGIAALRGVEPLSSGDRPPSLNGAAGHLDGCPTGGHPLPPVPSCSSRADRATPRQVLQHQARVKGEAQWVWAARHQRAAM